MGMKIDGVGGDSLRGTGATGGGNETAKVDLYPADVKNPDINKRVPPGVLVDPALQKLAFAHGQTDCPNCENEEYRNFGAIESIDQDGGKSSESDSDDKYVQKEGSGDGSY